MKTVLVVDDEAIVRSVVVRLLERAGYAVAEAGDTEQALLALETHAVALLICDLNLPDAQGTELVAALANRFSGIPAIVLTGAADSSQIDEAKRAGVARILFKPFAHQEFLDVVAGELAAGPGGSEGER